MSDKILKVSYNLKDFKSAQPSIFVSKLFIFEPLVLKQLDLYCKSNVTHKLTEHIDWYMCMYDTIVWRSQRISHDNDVTIVLAPNRISAFIRIFFVSAFSAIRIFWVLTQSEFGWIHASCMEIPRTHVLCSRQEETQEHKIIQIFDIASIFPQFCAYVRQL